MTYSRWQAFTWPRMSGLPRSFPGPLCGARTTGRRGFWSGRLLPARRPAAVAVLDVGGRYLPARRPAAVAVKQVVVGGGWLRLWALIALAAVGWLVNGAEAAMGQDWPTYAHDQYRSAATDMPLSLPLSASWVHQAAHPPTPAWPPPARFDYWHYKKDLNPRVTYDHAYHVAAAQGSVYYGSSTDDSLVCLDALTGQIRWTFYTEAPVRLAPTVAHGKLYAGSDDGYVYCLDAGSGQLVWKRLLGPRDLRCIGNERMISRWPIRSGILVDEGIAYCAAGMFPTTEGVFLAGLDAASGTPILQRQIQQSVQGYLSLTSDQLIFPSGRTSPIAYRRGDGTMLGEIAGPGGVYTVVSSDLVVAGQGDTQGELSLADPVSQEQLISLRGLHLIAHDSRIYVHGREELAALDRARFLPLAHRHAVLQRQWEAASKIEGVRAKADAARLKVELAKLNAEMQPCWLWKSPCDNIESLILVGDKLVAGGNESVAAYDTQSGQEVWRGNVTGRACGLAAAHGQLLVSTDRGAIHCFSPAATSGSVVEAESVEKLAPPASPSAQETHRRLAECVLRSSPTDQGFCLIIGESAGELAIAVAQQSRMEVIVVQRDPADAAATRRQLAHKGLYGTRVVVHEPAETAFPYPPYFANVIIATSQHATSQGGMSGGPASAPNFRQEVLRLLHPNGGVAWIEVANAAEVSDETLADTLSQAQGFTAAARQLLERPWLFLQRGPLEGGGEWTHGLADPGNTACTLDQLVHGPVRVQWFGRPGPHVMADRHHRNVPPLAKDGRLFVPGDNLVIAVDAYNGTQLWQRDIPRSLRLGAFLDCSNMVVDDRALYIVAENTCHVLQSATGSVLQEISLPQLDAEQTHHWGYIARVGQLLVGSGRKPASAYYRQSREDDTALWFDNMSLVTSDYLFAMEPQASNPAWTYQSGTIVNSTITIGGQRVYFLESHSAKAVENKLGRMPMSTLVAGDNFLVALDLATGQTIWKRPFDLSNCQHIVYINYAQEKLIVSGNRYVNRSLWYFFQAVDAKTGEDVWDASQDSGYTPGGEHGEQNRHPTIVGDVVYTYPLAYRLHTGERIEGWKFDRIGHGCGNMSASAHCIFWRGGNPWQWDLQADKQPHRINTVNRPGCFINMIPAGGILLIPEASSGCTCGYPLQTSLGYVPESALE